MRKSINAANPRRSYECPYTELLQMKYLEGLLTSNSGEGTSKGPREKAKENSSVWDDECNDDGGLWGETPGDFSGTHSVWDD